MNTIMIVVYIMKTVGFAIEVGQPDQTPSIYILSVVA